MSFPQIVPDSLLGYLLPISTTVVPRDVRVQDVAVDRQGTAYAVNYRLAQAGSATVYPAKVDRFRNVDTSIGELNGDNSLPAVSITNPQPISSSMHRLPCV